MEKFIVANRGSHVIHKAELRGHANHGWLDTYHSFSFARYFDPERVHFGALRVWNDDVIHPGKGFDLHPHDNMEIITIPLHGAVSHRDSMGHQEVIHSNEVQVMSAGKGLFHSEFNASNQEYLSLFQIWIFPNIKDIEPVYNQKEFDASRAVNQWQLLVGPVGESKALTIHQDAWISRVFLDKGKTIKYSNKAASFGNYLMVVDGKANVDNQLLNKRDAIGLIGNDEFEIVALEESYVINIEVPDISGTK